MNNVQSPQLASALARARVGGDWFLWIAGLSMVNSVITTVNPNTTWGFYFGLGITQIVDGVSKVLHGPIVGLIIDAIIASVWVWFGLQARKAKKWAFITGMIFYVIDAIILIPFGDFIGAAVHAYALFRIFMGFAAAREAADIMKQTAGQGAYYGGAPQQPGQWPPSPGQPQQPGQWPPTPGQPQQPGQWPSTPEQPQGGGWPQPSAPQFGASPSTQSTPAQPTAYPPPASDYSPSTPAEPSTSSGDWSQPAPPQALPSHWPAPAQPQPQPAPEES